MKKTGESDTEIELSGGRTFTTKDLFTKHFATVGLRRIPITYTEKLVIILVKLL